MTGKVGVNKKVLFFIFISKPVGQDSIIDGSKTHRGEGVGGGGGVTQKYS